MERSWDRNKPLVIFDELHTMRAWKAWLAFAYFARFMGGARRLQLVRQLSGSDRTYPNGDEVRAAATWLAELGPSSFVVGGRA